MSSARVPVQTGASSRFEIIVAIVPILFGVMFVGASGSLVGGSRGVALTGFTGIIVFFMVFLGVASVFVRNAIRRRASDAILDEQGVTFEGGPLHGQFCAWNDVDPQFTTLAEAPRTNPDEAPLKRVMIVLRHGASLMVAETSDAEEQRSLGVFVDALAARARAAQTTATSEAIAGESPGEGELLVCRSCGAPAIPIDANATTCRRCGASVTVPDDLRARVRAHRELDEARASSRKMVEKLLRQPAGRKINALLAIAAAAFLVAPIVIALGAPGPGLALLLLGAGGYGVVRDLTLDRRALRSILTRFGARPPRAAGEAPRCHACGAPLHAGEDDALVACVYCDAENVVGANLASRAATERAGEADLAKDLALQTRSKRSERLMIAGALVAGVALYFVVPTPSSASHHDDASPFAPLFGRDYVDSEGSKFSLACGGKALDFCVVAGPGLAPFRLRATRHLLLCAEKKSGDTTSFMGDDCRPIACDAASPCPEGPGSSYACEGGLCVDAQKKPSRDDDLALCMRGAGAADARALVPSPAIAERKKKCAKK